MFDPEKVKDFLSRHDDTDLIVVEGIKDRENLQKLGFENVYTISGKSLYDVLDELISFSNIAILTDFDKEGKKKAKILVDLLQPHGIKINTSFRRNFFSTFGIYKVEELKSFFKI
jgi:5S rRNA maturation endonuclease (ribonuclease M5)